MAYVLACVLLGGPLVAGGVIFWVDVAERAFARHELRRNRRMHPAGRA